MLPQGGYNFAIVFFALLPPGRNNHRVQTESAGRFNSAGIEFIGDDHGDAGVTNLPRSHVGCDGFEVGAASGEEDAKVFHEELSAVSIQQSAFRPNIIIY